VTTNVLQLCERWLPRGYLLGGHFDGALSPFGEAPTLGVVPACSDERALIASMTLRQAAKAAQRPLATASRLTREGTLIVTPA
jgi:hypothetical protein